MLFCNIKTIKDLKEQLEKVAKVFGEDTPVVISQDEEGNAFGDFLMFDIMTNKELYHYGCYYPADKDTCAVKESGEEKAVLIIYPAL